MVIMMDNEGPFERAARSLETLTGGPSTPVDVRTECEELREQLARARATVVALLAIMYNGDVPDRWDLEGVNGEPLVNDAKRVMDAFSITEEELAAEYQRQYDEWVQGSTDGQ